MNTLAAHDILSRYGALKITKLLDPVLIAGVRQAAESLYSERDGEIAAGKDPPAAQRQNYLRRTIPLNGIIVDGRSAVECLFCQVFDDLARLYLGKQPALEPNSYMREIIPGPQIQVLPFHQDETILKTRLLNIWIPLDECGVAAPGLEVVVAGRGDLLAVAGRADHDIPVERARIDEGQVIRVFGRDALWHPSFNPGDALVFAGSTVHRTHVRPQMSMSRMSAELRLV